MLDSFWFWPFWSGLGSAVLLGLAGASLFLRSASLQGLVVSQSAAAGGILASALVLPVLPGAMLLAGLVYWHVQYAKRLKPERILLFFLLCGASVNALLANMTHLHAAAERWLSGDIYYISRDDALWLLLLIAATFALYPRLHRVWLQSQLAPDIVGPRLSVWQRMPEAIWLLSVLVLSSYLLGTPAAVFMLLLPPWLAAYWSKCFRSFLILSVLICSLIYLLAWHVALWLDQPFAPLLILGGSLLGAVAYGIRKLCSGCRRR